MLKKFFRKYIPSHETVLAHRLARRLEPWLGHHNLWHMNRHSVAGAIALRVNLPVAMFTTLYTNPFTIVPLYVAAYAIGKFVTGGGNGGLPFDFDWRNGNWLAAVPAFLQWVAALGAPLFVGLFLLAGLLAAVSYFTVQGLWRLHVIRAWRKRQRQRGG